MIPGFWDASAVVPLMLEEPQSRAIEAILRKNPSIALWYGTRLECLSALSRREREKSLDSGDCAIARGILGEICGGAYIVEPVHEIWGRAERVLETHSLRSGDALQLAAALVWCREKTQGRMFVCRDQALRESARREGFTVLPNK